MRQHAFVVVTASAVLVLSLTSCEKKAATSPTSPSAAASVSASAPVSPSPSASGDAVTTPPPAPIIVTPAAALAIVKKTEKAFETINPMLDTVAQDARETGDARLIDDQLFALRRRVGIKPQHPQSGAKTNAVVTSYLAVVARQTTYPATFLGVRTYTWKAPKVTSFSEYELYVKADAASGWKISSYGGVPFVIKPVLAADGYVDAPPATPPATLREAVTTMRRGAGLGQTSVLWKPSKYMTQFIHDEHARYLHFDNHGHSFATEQLIPSSQPAVCAPVGGGRMVCFTGMTMNQHYKNTENNGWVSFNPKTPEDLAGTGGLKAAKYSTATIVLRSMFIVALSTKGTGRLDLIGRSDDMPVHAGGVRYR